MSRPQQNPLTNLTVILAVALIVRLVVALLLPLPADFWTLSEPGQTAFNLASGNGYTFDFYALRPDTPLLAFVPPLHPWFIALALIFPYPNLALGAFQAVLGALTVWLVYRIARAWAGPPVGALAGWGAALYPAHVLCTGQPISVVLHAFFLAAIFLAVWQLSVKPTIARVLIAGGVVGVYALSRPQILGFVPFIIAWLWLNDVRGRKVLRIVLFFTGIIFLVVLPWSIRNYIVLGRPLPTPTNGGVTFWNGNNPFTSGSGHDVVAGRLAAYRGVERDPNLPDVYEHPEPYPFPAEIESRIATIPELELDRAFYRAGLDYIRSRPADWLRLEGKKLVSFWLFRPNLGANPLYRSHWTELYRVQYIILILLAAAGIALSAKEWRRYSLFYALFGYTTLMHLAYNVLTRYRWEMELFFLIFAGMAVERIWRCLALAGKSRA
ncbi:MAG: glycosyltransferase family 39 protein [Anaerolineales bacterium]|nr:glycosyltransferase family 39 protein [Anaerolineales bacterium]